MRRTTEHPLISLLLFLFTLGVLGAWGVFTANTPTINSDMMSLILEPGSDSVHETALARVRAFSEQRQTWIVSGPDRDSAFAAANFVKNKLDTSDLFIPGHQSGESLVQDALTDLYGDHRFQLADDETLQSLEGGNFESLISTTQRALYSTARYFPANVLRDDPFLLRWGFLAALVSLPRPFIFDRGFLAARLDDRWTYLLPVRLKYGAFDFENQERVSHFATTVTEELELGHAGVKVETIGVIDFASANRILAMHEVGLIGSLSLLLVTLLLLSTFRHPRPFLAVIFTVTSGLFGGCAVSLLTFGSLHILTLVGGSSLIGISVDYAFHFLADGYRPIEKHWRTLDALQNVIPTITLGLATSMLGFFGLWSSGFRGLQEIAVFSASGLVVAFGSLIFAYPLLLMGWQPSASPPIALRLARLWRTRWSAGSWVLPALATATILLYILAPPLTVSTDMRLLAADSPAINQLTARSATFAASLTDSRFLVVRADDTEHLLQREEELRIQLDALVAQDSITQFQQLSRFVPSGKRQQEVVELNKALYLDPGQAITILSERIGLDPRVADSQRSALLRNPSPPALSLEEWLSSPVSEPLRHLWLGKIRDGVASIVTLSGVRDVHALQARVEPLDEISLIDSVADISRVFGLYVANAVKGLAIALVLIAALMVSRFGLQEGLLTLLGPLLSGSLTMTLLLFAGESINLFHVVGLALILGIGMDYTLFLKAGGRRPSAALAVLLAAITTECAFGLLALSALGAISSFGMTVAIGTAISILIAPLVARPDSSVDSG